MIAPARRALTASVFALTAILATPALAAAPPSPITEAEVRAAEDEWGRALIAISVAYDEGGIEKAKPIARAAIDRLYGYDLGPVLFKPTLTSDPQTFRLTKQGALAYFVGDDKEYPDDKGFARLGWRRVIVQDVGIQINGDVANTMGRIILYDREGGDTQVDKTWVFKKDATGAVRIIVHHSSAANTGK